MADSYTGMSDDEAQEFHKFYMQGFMLFTVIAIIAHILVWMWRPWIPGEGGYASLMDSINGVATTVLPFVA